MALDSQATLSSAMPFPGLCNEQKAIVDPMLFPLNFPDTPIVTNLNTLCAIQAHFKSAFCELLGNACIKEIGNYNVQET